jgi:hypothetical protein
LPSGSRHVCSQYWDHDSQPRTARTAGRRSFLHGRGHGFPHRRKRGTGCASRSKLDARGPCGRNACPSDRSACLQRRESGSSAPCTSRSRPGSFLPSGNPIGLQPFCSAIGGRLCTRAPTRQARRPLPSHRPFLFQNLRPIGVEVARPPFLTGRSYNRLLRRSPDFCRYWWRWRAPCGFP